MAGQSAQAAVNAIVDAFMPAGIVDEMAARLAVEQALATALGTADTFDPAAMDLNAVRIATLAFVAELVFVQVAGDAGRALTAVGPVAAVQREAAIRALVREVVDVVGTPILAEVGPMLDGQGMSMLISQVTRSTLEEMGTW